jgi:hypothetical protein
MVSARAVLAAAKLPTYILGSRHFDGVALIVIGVAILVGWIIVAIKNWANIVHTTTRLGYLAGDCALLAPGCIVSGIGLLTNQSWGPPTLLIAVGAAAFDLTHTFIFTAEIGYPKFHGKPLPAWVYVVVIMVILAVLGWIAWREIWFATGSHPPWYLWVLSAVATIVLAAIVILGVRDARKRQSDAGALSTTPPEM